MGSLILIALASAPQPAVVRSADCHPGWVRMAYERRADEPPAKRPAPRPAKRPCVTLASA